MLMLLFHLIWLLVAIYQAERFLDVSMWNVLGLSRIQIVLLTFIQLCVNCLANPTREKRYSSFKLS